MVGTSYIIRGLHPTCVLWKIRMSAKRNYIVCILSVEEIKEAVGEQNIHAVSLPWHKWEPVTHANHDSSNCTETGIDSGREEARLGGQRGPAPLPEPCSALYLPTASQKAAASPANPVAGLGQTQCPRK